MADEFSNRSSSFVTEFVSQAGAKLHPSLQIADLRSQGRGRGVVATTTIPADTKLFVIPRSYVMSVEASPLFQDHAEIFDELSTFDDADEILPKPWLDLILVLLHDYFHLSESKWKAYWGILPFEFDTLMFWTERELEELQASTISRHIGKDKADKLFLERVIPVIQRHASLFPTQEQATNEDLLRLCHRVGSLIMAYAFDLEKSASDSDSEAGEDGWTEDHEAETSMGMVPLADTLNADAEFNAHVEHEDNQLVVRTLREIQSGEEILNYYGPLPNCDLARRYGYTSRLHSRYDVVELSWELILSTINQQFGNVRYEKDEDWEDSFVLEREAGEPDDNGVNSTSAKFEAFPDELVNQVTSITSAALQIEMTNPSSEQAKSLKVAFLRIMNQSIEARLSEYPTTIDDDERIREDSSATPRLRMAIDIRLGEKRILHEARAYAAQFLQKYSQAETKQNNKSRTDEVPPGKRVRNHKS